MASIRDVSKHAGVSVATVSRALRNPEKVAESTRAKVLEAVRSVDYRPNMLARNFRSRQAFAVVVLTPNIANPFFARVVRGVEQVAQEAGYAVLLGDTQDDPIREAQYLELVRSHQADGVIQLSARVDAAELRRVWGEGAAPALVNACECVAPGTCPQVRIDNQAAARAMAEHLIGLGHRRFGLIAGPPQSPLTRDRLAGCRQAFTAAGIARSLVQVAHGDYSPASGLAAAAGLLADETRPTALFCFSDEMAIGALRAVRTAGLEAPRDVSVAGFDDIDLAQFAAPPLTTIHQPMEDLGRTAMSVLLDILNGGAPALEPQVLPSRLVIRESTAAPPGVS